MRIEDHENVYHATEPKEIEAILRKRYGDGINAFWLSHGDEKYPVISLLVNGELAYLHYFPNKDHPGFASVGDLQGLKPDEDTNCFLVNLTEPQGMLNESVISFPDALKAAQEFSISPTLPKSIQWDEL